MDIHQAEHQYVNIHPPVVSASRSSFSLDAGGLGRFLKFSSDRYHDYFIQQYKFPA